MKKVLLPLVLLLSLAATSHAESLQIGGQSLSYDAPKGYVRTMDGIYQEVLKITQQAMPRDLKIHAMYTPKAIDEAFRNDPAAGLDAYLLITTTSRLDNQLLSERDFASLREALTKAQGEISSGSIRKQVDEAWSRVTDGAVKIGDVQTLGVFDENKTSLSFMTLMTQVTDVNGQQQAVQQAMVSTTKLVKGKVVTINQYQMVKSEAELKKFQEDAMKVVKSMSFSEGGVNSSKSTISGGTRGARLQV